MTTKLVTDTFNLLEKLGLCTITESKEPFGDIKRNVDIKLDVRFCDDTFYIPNDCDIDFTYCENSKFYFVTKNYWNKEETEIKRYTDKVVTKSFLVASKCYLKNINVL